MASNAKRKTTMAKLNRETAVRERRLRKEAKKAARKQESALAAQRPPMEDSVVEEDLAAEPLAPAEN